MAEYIALDQSDAARRLVAQAFRSVERPSRFPNSGRRPPETAKPPYREVVVGPCRIFYRVGGREVLILYVMRGEQMLRPDALRQPF
jgi:toxin ParE1/3/4